MRKLLPLLLLPLVSCTSLQVNWHLERLSEIAGEQDPVVKEELQSEYDEVVESYKQASSLAESKPCHEWFDEALTAGFTAEQWMEPVARIMFLESGCNPLAKNPSSSAAGLMQELEMWADDCGITYVQMFDGDSNLRCAVHIYHVQGWEAWSTYS